MAIVFILLGALGATLFLVSKLGLDLPPAVDELVVANAEGDFREEYQIAA